MKTYSDPDIGRCDDCGSDQGRRVRRFRVLTLVNGEAHEQARVAVWLCRDCEAQHGE